MNDHWDDHARQWENVGPPLRPDPLDVAYVERLLKKLTISQAVLLGVTPELAKMRWPSGAQLTAVDRNVGMVKHIWPHERISIPAIAVLGTWEQLPFRTNSVDVVVGDGCYTLLVGKKNYGELSREVGRVLNPNGRFIMRFFLRPDTPELIEDVFADLRGKRIRNFHVLKWRIAMALHGSFGSGVAVEDVWKAWKAADVDVDALVGDLGWSRSSIETIDVYRFSAARYSFATIGELRDALAPYFHEVSCYYPSYELGDRCPTFLLAPRG